MDHISDSEDSDIVELLHTPEKNAGENKRSPPQSVLSHRFRGSPQKPEGKDDDEADGDSAEDTIAVMVPPPARPWEYQPWQGATTVDAVLEEVEGSGGELRYDIEFEDGRKERVTLEKLITLRNGQNSLDLYNSGDREVNSSSLDEDIPRDRSRMSSARAKRLRAKVKSPNYVDTSKAELDSEEDESDEGQTATKKRRLARGSATLTNNSTRQSSRVRNNRPPSRAAQDDSSSESDLEVPKRRAAPLATRSSTRNTRSSASTNKPALEQTHSPRVVEDDEDELAGDGAEESDDSDIIYVAPKGKGKKAKSRQTRYLSQGKKGRPRKVVEQSSSSSEAEQPTRRSGRERIIKSMKERDMDEEMYADEVAKTNAPKVVSIREVYQPLPKDSRFRMFHNDECDVCKGTGTASNKGPSPLIYCQGCSTSIHKVCLGYRSNREHMVTKIGHENFVMQCRRCIGISTKKDPSAPRLDTCQGCKKPGLSCATFSSKKTSKQEEKLREENNGEDPVTDVPEDLINNAGNILFRCISCHRGYHFEHLPGRKTKSKIPEDVDDMRDERFKEFSADWQCQHCHEAPAKPQGLVAWRPVNRESYKPDEELDMFNEDDKEYLIKWEDASYFKCTWMPGSWVWGVTAVTMRKAFARRDEGINLKPKWTNEEAIPEEYLRIDIIFDVEYNDEFEPESEKSDQARIGMVERVLTKFQGLSYDETVWEEPPSAEHKGRWNDFVAAYNEYLSGRYFKQPPASVLKDRTQGFFSQNYRKKVELKKQPSAIRGDMYSYQMEGVNWLLYNFHQKKNVILADEMGLGKTIQIIALIASLVKDNPKSWPFLVVTPNSTCPNWRREVKKWAPGLRVVAYYGAKQARDMAMKYELYPDNCSDMRAHVVVTSYEGPVDEHSRSFFRKIKWAGLIVDEGQRLKNDANLLYGALKTLKVPFQVLLTGTPLQNNKRELFNLLQYLDTSLDAAKLDEKYAELTKENLPELQELIRPFFLRRTKVQVLSHLPPHAQVIVPVSMSVVQRKLYKSILAKNPQLIKSIFDSKTELRPTERGNLNNILMQLRKCLCHPFLYSSAIEETSLSEAALHRNLIDASSKFQLLEIMLPKLKERGHRVLLFSQFLNQLDLVEDFLKGLDLSYKRLDGSISAQEKQKRIDEFNAPDSPIFAFLLSTRAGGVGINLATADTVIIMDPDFNPQQDIQAIARAHRIGQTKKVLVFRLMTIDSAEEKIMQIGRKKEALGALIESMGADDDAGIDLQSILKHGTKALFENDDDDREVKRHTPAEVDKLLDRTQIESTKMDKEKTAESQFSFARVWDKGTLKDDLDDPDAEDQVADPSVWEKILDQREADAAAEAAKNLQTFGRGKRARQNVNYQKANVDDDDANQRRKAKRRPDESASDVDFAAAGNSDEDDDSETGSMVDLRELESHQARKVEQSTGTISSKHPQTTEGQSALINAPKKRGRRPKVRPADPSGPNPLSAGPSKPPKERNPQDTSSTKLSGTNSNFHTEDVYYSQPPDQGKKLGARPDALGRVPSQSSQYQSAPQPYPGAASFGPNPLGRPPIAHLPSNHIATNGSSYPQFGFPTPQQPNNLVANTRSSFQHPSQQFGGVANQQQTQQDVSEHHQPRPQSTGNFNNQAPLPPSKPAGSRSEYQIRAMLDIIPRAGSSAKADHDRQILIKELRKIVAWKRYQVEKRQRDTNGQ